MPSVPTARPFACVSVLALVALAGCAMGTGNEPDHDASSTADHAVGNDARAPATDASTPPTDAGAMTGTDATVGMDHDAGTVGHDAGTVGHDAGATGMDDALQHCADGNNAYRAMVHAAALTRSSALETFSATGAMDDSASGTAHGHFMTTRGGGIAFAENEIPGWPLASYGSIDTIIDMGLAQMYREGPPPAGEDNHWLNMTNASYHHIGCGVYNRGGAIWVTIDFAP